MKTKLIVWMLVLIALCGVVYSADQSSDSGVIIITPKQNAYKTYESLDFEIQALNSTNHKLDTDSVNCTFKLYDTNNTVLLYQNMTYSESGFKSSVNGSMLSQDGDKSYNVLCSGSELAGFYSGIMTFTHSGHATSDGRMLAAVVMGTLIAFIFMFGAFQMSQEHFILKVFMYFFALFSLMIVPSAVLNGATSASLQMHRTVVLFFRIFVTYFSVYMVWHWLKKSDKWSRRLNITK